MCSYGEFYNNLQQFQSYKILCDNFAVYFQKNIVITDCNKGLLTIYNSSSSWLRFKTAHSLKTFLPRPPFLFSRRADRRRLRQRKNVNLLVNLLVLVLVNLLVFLVTMPVLSLIVVLVCLTICSKHSNKSIFQCGNQSVNKSVSIAKELPGQQQQH